jgi:DMSO/TMAO reductase YedYZ molybdopterin-dependent catalytic subunit
VTLTRRRFLSTVGAAAAAESIERLLGAQALAPSPVGRFIRKMPLGRFDGRPASPLGQMLGAGLDARLFTDLSDLPADSPVTPVDQFFVRTRASDGQKLLAVWTVGVTGRVKQPHQLTLDNLAQLSRPMGTHLLECSGNSDPANFGLISAATWSGAPLGAILDRAGLDTGASLVRITGIDDESRAWQTSVAGAGWIFSRDVLERASAFLATGMNETPLTRDHGSPVRLVVPNWYGCVAIKWVTSIEAVGDDEPATTQMREYAARTHQDGIPEIAREFQPAVVDLAAMPIRVEQWIDGERVFYRVIGICWGGSTPTRDLRIRFRANEAWKPVEHSPAPASTTTWSVWSHTWRPEFPGRYQIVLSVGDRTIRTRRLDYFYYTREVEIDRVSG